jgi:hypothetical protein
MGIYKLGVGDEDESMGVCAGFLDARLASRILVGIVKYRRTQSSHLSQLQLSTALLKTPLSPQYRTTHHSSTRPFTSVKRRLKLQLPRRSSFVFPCTAGRMRYRKKARPSRHAWCVKLSGSEYAPTGVSYSSYVVIVCQRKEQVAGAAFLRADV